MNQPVPFPPPLWRQRLLALPEVEPPATLWPRIAAARREARRRRRQPLWWSAAAALGLVAVLGFVLAGRDASVGRAASSPAPAPISAALPAVAKAQAAGATDPGLRRLDDEIALAYAQGAADEELAVLWQARAQLLESLQGPAPAVLARL
jgi:hypothetical protein